MKVGPDAKWEKGQVEFWAEEPNSTTYDFITFDIRDTTPEFDGLIYLLHQLSLIEYGTIYESIDCVRIKAK